MGLNMLLLLSLSRTIYVVFSLLSNFTIECNKKTTEGEKTLLKSFMPDVHEPLQQEHDNL